MMNFFHFLQMWEIPLHNPEAQEYPNPGLAHEPVESCEYLDDPLRTHEQPFLEPESGER